MAFWLEIALPSAERGPVAEVETAGAGIFVVESFIHSYYWEAFPNFGPAERAQLTVCN